MKFSGKTVICFRGEDCPEKIHVNYFLDLTELSIEGDNKTNLEVLMRKVGYSNTREFPTPGRRNLHITTSVM